MEPRHFWLRFLAYCVDYIVAWLVSFALLLPFLGNPSLVRLDAVGYRVKTCRALGAVTEPLAALVAPNTVDAANVCSLRVFWIDNGLTATVIFDRQSTPDGTAQKSLSVPIDALGNPVSPLWPQSALVLIFRWLVIGAMVGRTGLSPGKWLAGLRIVGRDGGVGLARGILREGLKLWPLIVGAVTAYLIALQDLSVQMVIAQRLASIPGWLWIGVAAAILSLYLVPLVRWRGAMFYDRPLRLKVVLRRKEAIPPAR